MNTPKISEVFHLAADKHLHDGVVRRYRTNLCLSHTPPYNGRVFSCEAVSEALLEYPLTLHRLRALTRTISEFLTSLGLDCTDSFQFAEVGGVYISDPEVRQGYRYSWLKFAAMIAEEQGQ